MRCIEGIFRAVWGAFMALFRWPPTRLLAMHLLLVVVEVWFGWPILLAYFSCLRLGGCQLIPPTPGNAWWPILLALVVAGILWESRNIIGQLLQFHVSPVIYGVLVVVATFPFLVAILISYLGASLPVLLAPPVVVLGLGMVAILRFTRRPT